MRVSGITVYVFLLFFRKLCHTVVTVRGKMFSNQRAINTLELLTIISGKAGFGALEKTFT